MTPDNRTTQTGPRDGPKNASDEIRYWRDERLIETYRRLSVDLQRYGFDVRTVDRMGRVEEELRERDLDPDLIAKDVANAQRSTE